MELSYLFIDGKSAIDFIKSDFQELETLTDTEKIFHPILYLKFNKTLKIADKKYTFFDKRIDQIYAYYDVTEKDKFALYILLDIKKDDLKTFSKIWGHPGNVSYDDFASGEFDSQMWHKDGTDVIIGRSFADDYGQDSQIVQLSNIKLQKLYGIE
ncbi:hypothetical protein [Pedobacter sp. KLB.chiD]|uniref:hypothetical protein n=1 Tax=Pedobacter sp. KLB.chiD TaxID=3387402 RepID=UPI00399C31A3